MLVKRNKHGLGVYADRAYKRGKVICVMKGHKVVPRTLEYHGGEFRKASSNPLQIGPALYIDLEKPHLYINHSCDPNAGMRGTATLFAIKSIKKGEEITFDYSTTIDESFECRCGAKRCRDTIVDFFGLPKKKQAYYARKGALPRFIASKYRRLATVSVLASLLVGGGCERVSGPSVSVSQAEQAPAVASPIVEEATPIRAVEHTPQAAPAVVLPIAQYGERRTFKQFGEYIEDRFRGYHTGDDIEYADVAEEVPVFAIADGVVKHAGRAAGYGGVIVIDHKVGDEKISAAYGHLDLGSGSLRVGDSVKRGEQIANLGDHKSAETDGERKHLHFGLYKGAEVRLAGYARGAQELGGWINPQDFFAAHNVAVKNSSHTYDSVRDLGGDIFKIKFTIPENWEIEYLPSLKALNLFTLEGSGTVRERSRVFIRYFDAAQFLTLSTVTIHRTEDLRVGTGNYVARRYDIEKKPGVPPFAEQPSWRNKRHIVTDFRGREGFTRYYVVAANPALDRGVYEEILKSMTIVE